MAILLSLAACSTEEKVTIYIPETMTSISKTDQVSDVYNYIFEEGWEEKESFTVVTQSTMGNFLGQDTDLMVEYSDKCVVTDYGLQTITELLDENGRVISSVTKYLEEDFGLDRQEISYTYDTLGRMLSTESLTYYTGRDEPITQSYIFTYRDTEQGSEGTALAGNTEETRVYNKKGQLIEVRSIRDEAHSSRVVYVYDKHGNRIRSESYVGDKRMTKTVTTYKAVEVSKEVADLLLQFKREN